MSTSSDWVAEVGHIESTLPKDDFAWTTDEDGAVFAAGAWSYYVDLYRERYFRTGDPRVEIEGGELVCDNRTWDERRADNKAYDARPEAERAVDEKAWDEHLSGLRFTNSWRDLFHTQTEAMNAPEPRFVIEGFLQEKSLTMLGGPPAAMKTYAALSMAKALITGEPLFDYFEVNAKSSRVLYLIPESSLAPFAERLKKLDLLKYVGTKFFFRTIDAHEQLMGITDQRILKAAEGADVFLDTAVRFMEGDENASADQRVFAENLFAMLKAGARTVTGLHHAPKAFNSQNAMTLENILRGSGDIGAMLATCWGLSKIDDAKGQVYFSCVKDRDFKEHPQPFVLEARPHLDETGKFRMIEFPGKAREYSAIKQSQRGKKGGRPKSAPIVTLGNIVAAKERLAAGESQEVVAKELGISRRQLARVLKDEELAKTLTF